MKVRSYVRTSYLKYKTIKLVFNTITQCFAFEQYAVWKLCISLFVFNRWFFGSFEAKLDTLDALIEETKEPELTGIRISMTQPGVILTVLVLVDILKPVNFLSLY
jgi:hypothetical protein